MTAAFHVRAASSNGGVPVLVVSGDVDVASSEGLLVAALDAAGDGSALVIDLGQVTFMDSTGLSALIRIRTVLAERGGDLAVAARSRPVQRVLQLAGMADAFADAESDE